MKESSEHPISIRQATKQDHMAIWQIFEPIAREGTTYAFAQDIEQSAALHYWTDLPNYTFVAEMGNKIVGTYYLKTNFGGPGSHVCNCGYMVGPQARGKGVATLMCQHSKQFAVEAGYKAMQFNFVASSNTQAIGLWQSLGFEQVGRLPRAFNHPQQGLIDALVMYQWLAD